ncbi:MAG TPA: Mur ligase family protein, partial [Fimbriimonas sp.]|nr:Mur ligase family protein [Fimbriimonas sp.]
AACSSLGDVVKTEGNRNSEFTSPLLWADVTPDTRVVIAEMGMRGFQQIAHLAKMHQPTVGLITNIGYSHSELVGGREGIAAAKGELLTELPEDGVAVLYSEDEYLGNLISLAGERKIRTFGLGGNADCQVTGYEAIDWYSSCVDGVLDGQKWSATMPTVGRHIATNVAAAILAATEAGVSLDQAADGIQNAVLPPLRMDIREYRGATLVMDNYNASPPAVLGAIQTLEEVPCGGRRYVVLGTMRELGEDSREAHLSVGRRLSRSKIDRIIVFGEETEFIVSDFLRRGGDGSKIIRVGSLEEIRQQLSDVAAGDAILVKGSRALELEKVFE